MPKTFKTYSRFEGGLNTKANARSIADNELAQAKNVIVDEFGIIKSCGRATDNTSNYAAPSIDASVPGYGLFQATFDYNASSTNTPTVRTFLADTDASSDTQVDVYDAGGSWAAGQIDLGGTTSGKVIYDMVDGVVRIADANLGANNTPKWYGHIERKLWLDTNGAQLSPGATDTWDQWLDAEQGLFKPWSSDKIVTSGTGYPTARGIVGATMGIQGTLTVASSSSSTTVEFSAGSFGEGSADRAVIDASLDTGKHMIRDTQDDQFKGIASGTDHDTIIVDSSWSLGTDSAVIIAPDAGLGFNLEVVQAAASGVSESGMTAAEYEFAQTFIYDETQESLPSKMAGVITVAASRYLKLSVIATRPFNKRITGGRIYWRDNITKGEWELLTDISLIYGCRTNLEEEYTGWGIGQLTTVDCRVSIGSHNLDTFESLNGYPSDVAYNHIGETGLGYKTSVVSNRRRFIANVKTKDLEKTDSISILGSDRIMYSEINKFDTFIPNNFIDIGINDGEEFVKLEAYADRLFAFKNNNLYIINIGGGSDTQWFLESEHKYMGVAFQAAVIKTDFGIAWVNENGLFFYDGSQVRNLQNKILESEWTAFVNDDTILGYEPTHKHLTIIRDAAASGGTSGDAYIYSFITNSFTFVQDLVVDNIKTNIIVDAYNNMTLGAGLDELESYNGEPVADNRFDIKLKDDDFGLPKVVKRIYGVTLEYASGAANSGALLSFYTNSSGTSQGGPAGIDMASTSNDLDVNKFTFSTPLFANSFQVHIDMNGDSIQKINSVAVEYRPIYKRIG